MIAAVSTHSTPDHRQLVRDAVFAASFRRLTVSAPTKAEGDRWEKVTLRPVDLKEGRFIQFVYSSREKSVARNFAGREAARRLDELLSDSFAHIEAQTDDGDIHIRITKKGRVLISRGAASRPDGAAANTHDRVKKYPLPAEAPDSFLQRIGIKNERGEIRPSMQAKFRQINAFLGLIEPLVRNAPAERPVRLLDCGCGSAQLTFAVYHYLAHARGVRTELVGIDRKPELVGKCVRLRDELGWSELSFHVSDIAAYVPAAAPDIVFSLHACDTATDEAIARAIRWGSRAIVAAPCCQHELHHQLSAGLFKPVLRHGILRERLADILTDAFRALMLRIAGYDVDVVEFVAPEYTPKNLVLRAVKGTDAGNAAAVREYEELKSFWNVKPSLESMAGIEVTKHLNH